MRINGRNVHVQEETLKFEKIRGEWRASVQLMVYDSNRPVGDQLEFVECFSWGKTKAEVTMNMMRAVGYDTKHLLNGTHLTQKVRAKKEAEQAQMQDFENFVQDRG